MPFKDGDKIYVVRPIKVKGEHCGVGSELVVGKDLAAFDAARIVGEGGASKDKPEIKAEKSAKSK